MKINLVKNSQTETTLVVFAHTSEAAKGKKSEASKKSPIKVSTSAVHKHLENVLQDGSVSAKEGDATYFRNQNWGGAQTLVVVGAGELTDAEAYRRLASCVHSALKAGSVKSASIDLNGLKIKDSSLQAFVEGLVLTDYSFDELKSKKKTEDHSISYDLIHAQAASAGFKKALTEALILAETVNFSRRLGDLPGNYMTPTQLANEAVQAAKGTGLKVTVWDKAKLEKEKMGGLLGVSRGSSQDPRFIIMEYKGAAQSKKPVVFVGKGLTFDSGGISIKPSGGMEEMKYDMCGGANVIGTMLAIAKLKLKVNVVGLVPSTENMPGPAATKPGDVHTARNGKTFEVNNTDAEGRLILADALSYATELEPQVIIDAATLTGAIVVALGNTHTGYFCRTEALVKKVEKAAQNSGELAWRMPLTDAHVKDMKGTFADLSNTSGNKGAGSATAAAFLEQFVGEGIPWAHFDIAGTAWAVGNRLNYCPKKGASGAMLRTFVELAKQY